MRAPPSTQSGITLQALMSRKAHAFTYAELVGMSSRATVQSALDRGDILRPLPNTYVAAEHSQSFFTRADAALLWAGSGAVLSGMSALHVWGLLEDPPDTIEIAVPHDHRPRTPGWLNVRRATYPIASVTVGRLATVTPAMAVVQGYGHLPRQHRAEAVFGATRAGLASPAQIREVLSSIPRVRDRRELERRLTHAERGAESFLEEVSLRQVFNTAEFSGFLRQHRIVFEGSVKRLDMFDPETRTAIELDGANHHGGWGQRQKDLNRDVELATIGVQTLRFTYRDIVDRPALCRERVREVLEARRQH